MLKPASFPDIAFYFFMAVILSLTFSLSGKSVDKPDRETEIQVLAQAYLATRPGTALSIGITDAGKCQYYNFGFTGVKKAEPVTSGTVYEIGSITKTFTGLLLAQAVSERRVKPNDDVRKYLSGAYPNLEFGGEPIRLLHLTNMTSGLPDNLPDLSSFKSPDGKETDAWAVVKALSVYSQENFLRDLHQVKLTAKPGEGDPAHSNVASQLLGCILEKVYGAPFDELVARYIEKPLGMRANRSSTKLAIGHNDQGREMPLLTAASAKASGGMRYSTADMLRYLQYQIAESSKAVVLSHTPNWYTLDNKLALSYYWIIESPESKERRFRYSGGTFGFASFCDFYPKRKLGVVLLSNRADNTAQDELKKLSDGIAVIVRR